MHIKITDGARTVLDMDMSFIAFSLISDGKCCGSIMANEEGASVNEIQAVMAGITISFQRLMDENPEVAEAAGELEKVIEEYKNKGRIFEGREGDDLLLKASKREEEE